MPRLLNKSTPTQPIRFGTDGWRAVIADQFTFENVRVIGQAVADYLRESGGAKQGLAVSYDTRFLSKEFARALAEVVASNCIPVFLSREFTPTPVLSYAVKQRGLAGGVMITASHNPYQYNGVKFKAPYGGPAMVPMTRAIEKHLGKTKPNQIASQVKKYLDVSNFRSAYEKRIQQIVRVEKILKLKGKIYYDPMNGAGTDWLDSYLQFKKGPEWWTLSCSREINPLFPEMHGPEPIPANMKRQAEALIRHPGLIGLTTDGDADRFGIQDGTGNFVQLHDLMPLLFRYLVESRGWKGGVIRTTSMADTVDHIAAAMGRPVVEVPVGFKNVTEKMLEGPFVIAGEESGGFGYWGHIPERDGILSCLLVLEMLAARRQTMSEMVAGLRREFGPFAYDRIDEYGELRALKKRLAALRKSPPGKIGAHNVARVNLIDGIKFYFTNGAWMLIRVSDTEPLFRVYVAGRSARVVKQILNEGRQLMTGR